MCKLPARALHVQCSLYITSSHSVLVILARFTTMPSLVLLAQKITKQEDPTYIKCPSPVWHVHLASLRAGQQYGTR